MSDAIIAPLWLSINMLLGYTAWRWSRRLFPADPLMEILVHTIVLSWAAIVAMATLLGLVYCLTGLNLLLGVALLCLAALYPLKRLGPPTSDFRPLLSDWSDKIWLSLWCLQLGFWIGHVVSSGLWHFPMDWDTLNYHLPLVNHWLQAGTLNTQAGGRWYNPGNNELLAVWATGAFSGDFLAVLNNLPPTILFACSAVGLGLRLGLPKALANLTGFALMANYVVLKQLIDNENDVAVAACFFAALFYTFRFLNSPLPCTQGRGVGVRGPDLYLAAISLGLLLGIKYYASGYAALGLATLVMLAALSKGRRPALQATAIGLAGMLLWGGYWYLRNFVITGSPIYPKEFFTDADTLSHIHPELAYTSFFGNRRPELLPLYIEALWKLTGPYQLGAFFAAPFSFVWLIGTGVWSWFRGQDKTKVCTRLIMAMLLAGTGLLLGSTPLAVEDNPGTLNQMYLHYCPVRYGMCFLSMATLALILVLHDILSAVSLLAAKALSSPKLRIVRFLYYPILGMAALALAGILLFQIFYVDGRLLFDRIFCSFIGLDVLLVFLLGFMGKYGWPRLAPWLAVLLGAGILALSTRAGTSFADYWHGRFKIHYNARSEFPDLAFLPASPERPITICVLENRYYPYFGSRRQYRVIQPVFAPSGSWFLDYFQREKVDYVASRKRLYGLEARVYLGLNDAMAKRQGSFRVALDNPNLKVTQLVR